MGTEATITRGTIVPGGEMANHLAIQMPAIASSCRATVPPCRSSSHAEWARHGGTLRRCQPPQEMSTSTGDVNLLKRCQPPQEMSTSSGDVNLLRRCQPPQEMPTSTSPQEMLSTFTSPQEMSASTSPQEMSTSSGDVNRRAEVEQIEQCFAEAGEIVFEQSLLLQDGVLQDAHERERAARFPEIESGAVA